MLALFHQATHEVPVDPDDRYGSTIELGLPTFLMIALADDQQLLRWRGGPDIDRAGPVVGDRGLPRLRVAAVQRRGDKGDGADVGQLDVFSGVVATECSGDEPRPGRRVGNPMPPELLANSAVGQYTHFLSDADPTD